MISRDTGRPIKAAGRRQADPCPPLLEPTSGEVMLLTREEAAGDFQFDGLIKVLHLRPRFVSQLSEVLQTLCLKGRDQEGTRQAKGALRDLFDC